MSCVVKEVFLQEHPYFQTYVTFSPGNEHMLYVQDIFHEPDVTGSVIVLKKPVSLSCENCKKEIEVLKEDDSGEPIDWNTPWEQYLCDVCHSKIWDELFKSACGVCETEPCKRGCDCWVNPWPRIMYLCYVAPRVEA